MHVGGEEPVPGSGLADALGHRVDVLAGLPRVPVAGHDPQDVGGRAVARPEVAAEAAAGLDATGQDLAVPALLAVPELAPVGVAVAQVAGFQEQQHPASRGSLDDAVAAGEVGLVGGAQVAGHQEGCLPVPVARRVVRDERFDEVRHDGVEAARGPVREVLVDLLEGGHA